MMGLVLPHGGSKRHLAGARGPQNLFHAETHVREICGNICSSFLISTDLKTACTVTTENMVETQNLIHIGGIPAWEEMVFRMCEDVADAVDLCG